MPAHIAQSNLTQCVVIRLWAREPEIQCHAPFVDKYHYVFFPQDMNGVVDNMYNAAYKFRNSKKSRHHSRS